jgi:anti-sigma regulatory factor (Ser/Thr protein kinase)
LDDTAHVTDLAQVPHLRARFTTALQAAGVDGDELQGWALVFTELVNNALEHGCRMPGDIVSVRWWGDPAQVGVQVTETCTNGLTSSDFEGADCDGFAETGRGAGLFLIRAWVDAVDVGPGPHGGTQIRIVRRRAGAEQQGTQL